MCMCVFATSGGGFANARPYERNCHHALVKWIFLMSALPVICAFGLPY